MAKKTSKKATKKQTTTKRVRSKSDEAGAQAGTAQQEHDLLTMPEAIDRLKTTRATFYRWLKAGKIQGVKVGRQWRFAREQIERFLRGEESSIDLAADVTPLCEQLNERYRELTGSDFEMGPDRGVVVLMINLASRMRASDIHIEPQSHADPACPPEEQGKRASVRFRIDGVLQPIATFSLRALSVVIDRWKAMSQCDVREHVRPQDGRITLQVESEGGDRPMDVRVSCLPAALGECLTARLLDRSAVNLSLDSLGLAEPALATLRRGLALPNGLIMVAGPTGCGKTTTLYACLKEIVSPQMKVMSVEDPVEYLIPGVVQTPVDVEGGRTFPAALLSMLRSDPDVILAGEIRDLETLMMCIQAGLTGHLVFSTLHTRSAAEGLERMVNVGAESHIVGATVRMVLAQRLIRRLCPECSEPSPPDKELLDRTRDALGAIGRKWADVATGGFRKAVGCPVCGRSGYLGRMCLIEILEMSPEIDRALRHGAPADELQVIAVGQGMTTMMADGVQKASEGLTTLEEVLRVLAT